jgi:hypothetical protein
MRLAEFDRLLPGKFSFFSEQGKVDSQSALHSAMQSVSDGVFVLEVREHADGKVMREVHSAMQALEERMCTKMEDALAQMRSDLEPKLHGIAEEHADLKTKFNELVEESLASRTDLLDGDDELAARITGLEQDCLAMRIDSLEWEKDLSMQVNELMLSKAVMEAEASMQAATSVADELRTQEARDCEIRQEMALQKECEAPPTSIDGAAVPSSSPPVLEQSTSLGHAESWTPKIADPFAPIPYSTKGIEIPRAYSSKNMRTSADLFSVGFGTGAAAPFAQFASAPRLRPSRSSPLLPPLN